MFEKELELKTLVSSVHLCLATMKSEVTRKESFYASLRRDQKYSSVRLAFAYEETKKCWVHVKENAAVLWVGTVCFDIHPKDVELIVNTYGVSVDRDPPLQPPLGINVANEDAGSQSAQMGAQ